LKLSDFDFHLPEPLIAQKPAPVRDGSRLMVVERGSGALHHDEFSNLPKYLSHRPLMVFNDTRVIPAKLFGVQKTSGKPIEALLVTQNQPDIWEVLVRGLAKIKPGTLLDFGSGKMQAKVLGRSGDRGVLQFFYTGDWDEILSEIAHMPLPPYIRRDKTGSLQSLDRERYQTVFAHRPGAIAAPTAGLHFTDSILEKIKATGTTELFLTLDIGVGTFIPIRTESILEHRMESESYRVSADTWNQIVEGKKAGRKILAVGTTSTRVLETLDFSESVTGEIAGSTDIFMVPGKKFRNTDELLTNFHLPKSTLFLLVCAFAGRDLMQRVYQEAIKKQYRFFSYGDAMLIL
jgi:S-adenosylmethionine:tRNA ribosyltransferase-isomerase